MLLTILGKQSQNNDLKLILSESSSESLPSSCAIVQREANPVHIQSVRTHDSENKPESEKIKGQSCSFRQHRHVEEEGRHITKSGKQGQQGLVHLVEDSR